MNALEGVWRLVDSRAWNESIDRLAPLPYGTDPIGQLVFSRGRMLVSLWGGDVDPAPERHSGLGSYGGRYTFDGSTLVCDVVVASELGLIGGPQVRGVVMLGDNEMLWRPPTRMYSTQLERRELVWQRVWPAVDVTDANFDHKLALITGSSGGLGLRVAEKLAAAGATVVINSRTRDNGEHALAGLKAISARVHLAVGDCTDPRAAAEVARTAAEIRGGIDILVSSGAQGSVPPKPFADMTAAEIVEAYQSRFFARVFPVHAALPHMRERGGSIVMVGTDAARHPTPGESIVGAVGAGVILMTKALAKEFAGWRIRVNAVSLTLTSDTPSWDRIFGAGKTFESSLFSKASERFPWGRPPTAEEVARVAVFLASEEAAQVTGQTISVNGGLSFGGW